MILATFLCVSGAAAQRPALRRAPGFALPDMRQQVYDLGDYRGRWVLLDFMKTDCPHCQQFSGTLEQAKSKYGDKVAVLSVVLPPDNVKLVQEYIAKQKVTVPILFDCGQMAYSYIRPSPANPAIDLPHLFIINPDGYIVRDAVHRESTKGLFEGVDLFAELDKLIGSRSK